MSPVLLLQLNIHFTTVFELRAAAEEALVFRPNQGELDRSRLAQIARYVAATGQVGRNNNTEIYTNIMKHYIMYCLDSTLSTYLDSGAGCRDLGKNVTNTHTFTMTSRANKC